jgi:hypothetical protein
MDMIDCQLFALDQVGKVKAQGGHVGDQLRSRFLKGDEQPGLAEVSRPPHNELHGKQRLAGAGSAADQGGTAPGQTAKGDFVKSVNPTRALGYAAEPWRRGCVGASRGLCEGTRALHGTASFTGANGLRFHGGGRETLAATAGVGAPRLRPAASPRCRLDPGSGGGFATAAGDGRLCAKTPGP